MTATAKEFLTCTHPSHLNGVHGVSSISLGVEQSACHDRIRPAHAGVQATGCRSQQQRLHHLQRAGLHRMDLVARTCPTLLIVRQCGSITLGCDGLALIAWVTHLSGSVHASSTCSAAATACLLAISPLVLAAMMVLFSKMLRRYGCRNVCTHAAIMRL